LKVESGVMKWMESGEVIKVTDKVKSQHGVAFGRDVEFEYVVNHVEKEFGKCFLFISCVWRSMTKSPLTEAWLTEATWSISVYSM
jgi:hypothetical protein